MSFIRFEDVTKIYQQGEVEIHALIKVFLYKQSRLHRNYLSYS